jgi:hypothetical protein
VRKTARPNKICADGMSLFPFADTRVVRCYETGRYFC